MVQMLEQMSSHWSEKMFSGGTVAHRELSLEKKQEGPMLEQKKSVDRKKQQRRALMD